MVIMTGGAVRKSLQGLIAAGALLALTAATAEAAGLGKLTVLSNLGEPLRAEIDVVAVEKTELETLVAKLGAPDAYAQSNLPYPPPSLGLKVSLEKRASGEPYIGASTVQPVNEPFVDILVDLSWTGGRIQRAYTALLDPPTFASEQPKAATPAAAAAPEVRPAPEVPPQPQVQTRLGSEFEKPAPAAEAAAPAAEAGAPAAPAAPEVPSGPPAEAGMPPSPPAARAAEAKGDTYTVKRGDTLSKIAREYKPDDVTTEQMLVALFRGNKDAFAGKNMNRLKTGKVIQIPEAEEIAAIDTKTARKEVRLQTADFNAYRQRLAEAAGMGAAGAESAQAAAGKITAGVQEQAPGKEQPRELLKLSKGEAPGAGGASARGGDLKAAQDRIHTLEEEVAARDKTIGEQKDRVAKLEKTIKDMQVLIEMKNKSMAEKQAQAAAPMPEPAKPATAKPPAPEAPKPEIAQPAPAPTPSEPPATQPGPTAAAPMPPAGGPMAQSGVAAAPKPRPKPKIIAPPPPEPSLVDTVLNEPLYLAGGGGALALLGGLAYMFVRRRRSGGEDYGGAEKKTSELRSEGEIAEEAPAAPAVAGGPRPAPAQVSEEVDPLAEAEIYLAYGRDAQAEDILREALAVNPRRQEVQLKLLEIYAKRKDVAAFDGVARELQVGTGGQGEVWAQAARLGFGIDPNNPRYAAGKGAGAAAPAAAAAAAAAVAAAGSVPGLDDKLLDFNIGIEETDLGTKTDIDLSRLGGGAPATTTDIDLTNLGAAGTGADIDLSVGQDTQTTLQPGTIDLDLGPAEREATASTPSPIDFDFDLNSLSASPETQTQGMQTVTRAMQQTVADVGTPESGSIEFDLSSISLDTPGGGRQEPTMELSSTGRAALPEIDLSNISLDLGGVPEPSAGGAPKDDRWYDVQTKFDLAKAYQEMGDKEGAREILREVIAEGDDEQKSAAQKVLETLS
jgi:pilus assembly protein FimV